MKVSLYITVTAEERAFQIREIQDLILMGITALRKHMQNPSSGIYPDELEMQGLWGFRKANFEGSDLIGGVTPLCTAVFHPG